MYNEYFGLAETPFSIAPDPRYLYMSEAHREALAHLLYGVSSDGGFVLLTGEVGTGKTTVCRCLLEQLPEDVEVAYVINPKQTSAELLATICDDLGIAFPEGNSSIKVFVDRINAYLLDAHGRGRKTVLVIDEAQNLSPDVLEQLRLLTNLETSQRKLLQIILLGQPELLQLLARPDLRQLSQRITARYHLGPLSRKEVGTYVNHRLAVAGLRSQLFPPATLDRLHKLTGGVPRLINVLCDRALLGAYVKGEGEVNRRTLRQAAREVLGEMQSPPRLTLPVRWLAAGVILVAAVLGLATLYFRPELLSAALKPAQQGPAAPLPEPAADPPQAAAEGEPGALVIVAAGAGDASEKPLSWPAELPIEQSKTLAFESLFQAWGMEYQGADGNACDHAESLGMRCLHRRGSLGSLRQLDLPAVLRVVSAPGEEFFATLVSLRGDRATFALGPETRVVSVRDLESIWFGEFSLLWRVPGNYRRLVAPGGRGPEVAWLDEQLARIYNRAPDARRDPILEGPLLAELKAFQLREGLEPDGILGTNTLIRLNAALDPRIPKLLAPREE
ncbi:ATPase AAA [Desulfuromonas versatilis]|uniref:ATPase AAA n=1 Tax=Desulfuromonas versatilis TaxID=2802975 RepID=A0ABM9SE19_9BACT|nr:ExeA family protein [Desulfuromonas versatilis]BCR03643.1 ATPase AAA [Desulfuromonas versatilis]